MKMATRQAGEAVILDVSGDIDLQSSPDLRKALLASLKDSSGVVLNLIRVRYIDSSGIASLVEGWQEAKNLQHRLVLFGLTEVARNVLKLTHLLKLFEVYETESEALSAFSRGEARNSKSETRP
ncbi:MAG TPA: STAS domain-containing protein [Terriglobia bacterium]|nr:STAS domain-containing protein [Terriglobia bacterium]